MQLVRNSSRAIFLRQRRRGRGAAQLIHRPRRRSVLRLHQSRGRGEAAGETGPSPQPQPSAPPPPPGDVREPRNSADVAGGGGGGGPPTLLVKPASRAAEAAARLTVCMTVACPSAGSVFSKRGAKDGRMRARPPPRCSAGVPASSRAAVPSAVAARARARRSRGARSSPVVGRALWPGGSAWESPLAGGICLGESSGREDLPGRVLWPGGSAWESPGKPQKKPCISPGEPREKGTLPGAVGGGAGWARLHAHSSSGAYGTSARNAPLYVRNEIHLSVHRPVPPRKGPRDQPQLRYAAGRV
eukprot:gene502-biopygen1767